MAPALLSGLPDSILALNTLGQVFSILLKFLTIFFMIKSQHLLASARLLASCLPPPLLRASRLLVIL